MPERNQIPTDLAKAGVTVQQVTQYAKQLPKPSGAIVSKGSGVAPINLSPTQQEGIVALHETVTKTLPALQDKFGKMRYEIVSNYTTKQYQK